MHIMTERKDAAEVMREGLLHMREKKVPMNSLSIKGQEYDGPNVLLKMQD